MDIKEELLREHSKQQAVRIAEYIGTDEERLSVLMEVFLKGEYKIQQRSAWALFTLFEMFDIRENILSYLAQMVALIGRPVHDSVIRNTVHILESIEIPDELRGEALDKCFTLLTDAEMPVAIRVFSMTVIYNISQFFPEIKNELRLVIEDQMPYGSPGFRNRGGKLLKKLYKEID